MIYDAINYYVVNSILPPEVQESIKGVTEFSLFISVYKQYIVDKSPTEITSQEWLLLRNAYDQSLQSDKESMLGTIEFEDYHSTSISTRIDSIEENDIDAIKFAVQKVIESVSALQWGIYIRTDSDKDTVFCGIVSLNNDPVHFKNVIKALEKAFPGSILELRTTSEEKYYIEGNINY